MNENPPTKRSPVLHEKYVLKNYRASGKDYLLYAGLLDAAHAMGLSGITTTLITSPSKAAGIEGAIVHAVVEMPWGSFSALGEADPTNVGPMTKNALIRMAETRAKARAFRDALNASEFEVEDDLAVVNQETGEITRSPSPSARPAADSYRVRSDSGPQPVPPASGRQAADRSFTPDRPGDAAPRRIDPQATTGRAEILTQRDKWEKLVKLCQDDGWTLDPEESIRLGTPLIPTLTEVELADASEVVKHGRKLQEDLRRWRAARDSAPALKPEEIPAEGDGEGDGDA